MGTIRVTPSGNAWKVTKNGTTQSNHRKKRRAVSRARTLASSRDTLVIYRSNGTIQSRSGGR